MGVESLEAKLLDAIAKQNALLLTVQKKHPDFAFLLARDVQLQQAQCWLNLSRIRRLAVATSSSTSGGRASVQTPLDRAALDGAAAYLAHARRIYLVRVVWTMRIINSCQTRLLLCGRKVTAARARVI
jgi:hypothetical protein